MAKKDYKNSVVRTLYKTLLPKKKLVKVVVSKDETRSRAELLDMVEELFETKSKHITAENLRAFLHILVKSTKNSNDDR